ncbi:MULTISPECIES: hypothetical protein [unclassified Nocardiopsis]|uniref:hypothetical protein n=1 Tax=unclassified Nocardiopsis TaxID=2649073 RepID=UPI00135986D9|nr:MULTISPECIES: hypothetical protein [unclassified Nocardiopsis]
MSEHSEPATYGTTRRQFEDANPGWTIERRPQAVPGRRWVAQPLALLTARQIERGWCGAVYGPDIPTVHKRLTRELATRGVEER